MPKTTLQLWQELQTANTSNSTGYMNEFVSSENPLRTGKHVFEEPSDIEPTSDKIQRMSADRDGKEGLDLQNLREELSAGNQRRHKDSLII